MDPILEVKNLTKDFAPALSLSRIIRSVGKAIPHTRALDNLSFNMHKGSIVAILGPNGAGKTTLLKIISTLILPDSGTVKVNGLTVGEDDDRIKAAIGLSSSSERHFYWRLTGRQNLEFFAALHGMDKAKTKSRIEELFQLFEVTYQDRRFDAYSTGMQQKFALIHALLHDPQILLLDEPTKSLDFVSAIQLKDFVKDTLVGRRGKTVILTTHHMDEAMDFADIFMILHKGALYGFGSIGDLRKKVGDASASLGAIFLKLTQGGHP